MYRPGKGYFKQVERQMDSTVGGRETPPGDTETEIQILRL